ncbi:hypothetical protein IV203_025078 [Nitzschia inconspicua]|uniref:Uncharacterized protein n=1 Tax=Nitzschia inconspicua TaxID=303405 RepID=A0A9K3P9U7_9STRA|nr:hypothetical protein IV203_025175 [Nitzschia inconspicua]KAG7365637.1 hypothetical protein IV203_025078 [Nitzschia inconspicua]
MPCLWSPCVKDSVVVPLPKRIFYFTNFAIVRFIPKAAFSSLLVLRAVDTIVTNEDAIQVLVLQNYLFFVLCRRSWLSICRSLPEWIRRRWTFVGKFETYARPTTASWTFVGDRRDKRRPLRKLGSNRNVHSYEGPSSSSSFFRLKAYSAQGSARIGPGWVVGTNEFVSGQPPWGIFRAATLVRLHHLPFTTIRTIEQKDPVMILRLYKLLAHMMVRNETNTVAQLTVMRNILSAPAHSKPIPRAAAMRTMLR